MPEGYIGIYDIADLYGIRNDLTANYILMKDIDMSEDTAEGGDWNLTGHGWTPIDEFAGTFDFGKYERRGNLKINCTDVAT